MSALRKSKNELLQKCKDKSIGQDSLVKPVELKKDPPGPGHYNVNFEVQLNNSKAEQFQFFGSSSDRFPAIRKNLEEENISPGKYNREFPGKINFKFEKSKKVKKEVPFGASEDRFYDKKPTSGTSSPDVGKTTFV